MLSWYRAAAALITHKKLKNVSNQHLGNRMGGIWALFGRHQFLGWFWESVFLGAAWDTSLFGRFMGTNMGRDWEIKDFGTCLGANFGMLLGYCILGRVLGLTYLGSSLGHIVFGRLMGINMGHVWDIMDFGTCLGGIFGNLLGSCIFGSLMGNFFGNSLGTRGFWDLLGIRFWDMFGTSEILGLFLGTPGTLLGPLWDKILSTSVRI
eukprot:jgi/Botrbrau1/11566/Bobra.60_1s0018.1